MLGSLRDSPVRLSSRAGQRLRCSLPGGGGLLTVAVALVYVGLTSLLGYQLLLAALTGAPLLRVLNPLGLGALLSATVVAGPLLVARRRLRSLEAR